MSMTRVAIFFCFFSPLFAFSTWLYLRCLLTGSTSRKRSKKIMKEKSFFEKLSMTFVKEYISYQPDLVVYYRELFVYRLSKLLFLSSVANLFLSLFDCVNELFGEIYGLVFFEIILISLGIECLNPSLRDIGSSPKIRENNPTMGIFVHIGFMVGAVAFLVYDIIRITLD